MSEIDTPVNKAADAVPGGDAVAIPTVSGLVDGVLATARVRPLASATASLAADATRIIRGSSDIAPERGDRRFADPTWTENPVYRRWMQLYLAGCTAADSVVDEVSADAEPDRAERAKFVMNILTSATAPTNFLPGNPAALKKTFESGGTNLARGLRNFVDDVRHNGAMPSTAKRGAFELGRDLALTPGYVIDKDEVAELIQYTPSTETVRERPLLIVPPPIGRYYFLDLRPGRSFVEYAVSRGLQTHMLSWRNPSAEQADWDLETYADRIVKAVAAVVEATGASEVNIAGFCAGGILNSVVLNKFAAESDRRINAAMYAVTMLDFGDSAPINAFRSAKLIDFTRGRARKQGITTARAMGSAFTWMRPNDLVWNYWVNNYLMGMDPPVFDILSWNADGTNLPAKLHQQFLDYFQTNPLPKPGAVSALGVPVDLSQIKVPTYVVGAVNDHLTPWKSTFHTTQLLSGESTFTMSNAGHIAALVNPPNNPKASYFTAPARRPQTADAWLETAQRRTGSWWEDWADWCVENSGKEIAAPDRDVDGLAPAPGSYVAQQN